MFVCLPVRTAAANDGRDMFIALESGISMTVQQDRIAELEAELGQLRAAVYENKIVEQATGAIAFATGCLRPRRSRCYATGPGPSGATSMSSQPRSRPTAGVSPGPSFKIRAHARIDRVEPRCASQASGTSRVPVALKLAYAVPPRASSSFSAEVVVTSAVIGPMRTLTRLPTATTDRISP